MKQQKRKKVKFTAQDLKTIAEFNSIVMNYLKMKRLENNKDYEA